MPRVSGSIPNLINGVSQQPPQLRLASQGEVQLNAYSTVVNGLTKRPPSQHVSTLETDISDPSRTFTDTHLINRDEEERYIVAVDHKRSGNPSIEVYDLDGNRQPFTASASSLAYLQNARPGSLKFLTVADFTFILNTNVTTRLGTPRAPKRIPEALINVRAGNFGRTYRVILNGRTVGTYQTPDGSSASQTPQIAVDFIARSLVSDMVSNGVNGSNGWTLQRIDNVIHITRLTDFTIETNDGFNGNAMNAIKDEVKNFTDLPALGEDGFTVKITNSGETEFDDYYVRFETASGPRGASRGSGRGRGLWREAPEPNTLTSLNPSTMPQALVRRADGTFSLEPLTWNERLAGGEEGLPSPSFINRRLGDMFFYKNRLGFVSDENVIMSRAGDFFNFFRTTATDLLDDDPIDVATTHNKVSILAHALPFQDRLLVFSAQTQFQVRGGELLTPRTVSIRPTTEFESSTLVRPVATGRNVYIPVDRGEFTMLREYFFNDGNELADASDITSHVPQYVLSEVDKMEASTHEDIIIARSRRNPSQLYVYKYLWVDGQKVQSAWSIWELPGATSVLDFGFINSELILITERNGQLHIEKMDLQPGVKDVGTDFITHLDRRIHVDTRETQTAYDSVNNRTTFVLPYEATEDVQVVTAASSRFTTDRAPGNRVNVVNRLNNSITLEGDFRNTSLYFGVPYRTLYRISPIHIRQGSEGGGVQAVTIERLQVQRMIIQYDDTGFIQVNVTPHGRSTRKYVFNGRQIGNPANIVGQVSLATGAFKFPILSRSDRVDIDVISESYLPFEITSVEWAGQYVNNTRRL